MLEKSESLFDEHKKRFFILKEYQESYYDEVRETILQQNDTEWARGYISWLDWKLPFLRNLIPLLERLYPENYKKIYDLVSNTLAETRGNFYSVGSEEDEKLIRKAVLSLFMEDEEKEFIELIDSIHKTPNWQSFILKYPYLFPQTFVRESKNKKIIEDIFYENTLLNYRIMASFLYSLESKISNEFTRNVFVEIGRFSFKLILSGKLIPPNFQKHNILDKVEVDNPLSAFFFWSWQYTYRNSKFIALRNSIVKLYANFFEQMPITNAHEYLSAYLYDLGPEYNIIYINDKTQKYVIQTSYNSNQAKNRMVKNNYNEIVKESLDRFKFFPTWEIKNYTSDYILQRILYGKFSYSERHIPKYNLKETNKLCNRDCSSCSLEGKETLFIMSGEKEVCSSACQNKIMLQEFERENKAVHQIVKRIRPEKFNRAIGLWLWDYVQEHKCNIKVAIDVLVDKYFPDTEPNWNWREILKCKDGTDWYDCKIKKFSYREFYRQYETADLSIRQHRIEKH